MKAPVQVIPQDDASLLVNNKAAISRELEQKYRQYLTRSLSEEALKAEIKRILNGNWDTTPIERLLEELELRYELREQLSRMLTDSDPVKLNTNQLVLDANHRINIGESIRKYYLTQLNQDHPNIRSWYCAIYGFTEFLGEHYPVFARTFFSDENKHQKLAGSFRIALLYGNLTYARKIWEIYDQPGQREALISEKNFYAVAIAQTTLKPEIKQFIQQCVADLNLTDKIPTFSDDELFPIFARSNNRDGLLACWKKPRSAQANLELLTKDNCKIFDNVADDFLFDTRDELIKCLIELSQSKEIVISNEVWKRYFEIAVMQAPLSTVKLLWDAITDPELRIELLNDRIFIPDDFHIPIMKFLLEQAESYPENTIAIDTLEYMKQFAHALAEHNCARLKELFFHSPLTKNIQLHM